MSDFLNIICNIVMPAYKNGLLKVNLLVSCDLSKLI